MRVDDLRLEADGDWTRLAGRVTWEDRDRPPLDLYFAVPAAHARHLRLNGEAFLAACILPASVDGEKRLAVAAPICPIMINGILDNLELLNRWYDGLTPIDLDLEVDQRVPEVVAGEPTGMFFSGGIDSRFTLYRWNNILPPEHHRRIGTCFLIDYDEFRRHDPAFAVNFQLENALLTPAEVEELAGVTQDMGADLIPVRTNVQALNDDGGFWLSSYHSAAMAAVAHAVSGNLATMMFAASQVRYHEAHGLHPLTVPNWSSFALRIRLDTVRFKRFQKTKAVANWPAGLTGLKVCIRHNSPIPNCGACEKCMRTALMLLCLGKLAAAPFPYDDMDEALLDRLLRRYPLRETHYRDLIGQLTAAGRPELAALIRRGLDEVAHAG